MKKWTNPEGTLTIELPDEPTPQDVRQAMSGFPEILSVAIYDHSIAILFEKTSIELRPQ